VLDTLGVCASACVLIFVQACGSGSGGTLSSTVLSGEDDPAIAALPFIEDELLVQPYPGADAKEIEAVYESAGAEVVSEIVDLDLTVLRVAPGTLKKTAEILTDSGLIESVQKNYLYQSEALPNDPYFTRQAHLEQVRAPLAWDTTIGSEDVIIAVVDTGINDDHVDLRNKVIGGWNVYDDNSDYSDVMGHGTLVAGVAGADSDNGTGVAGVAWDNPILAVRVGNRKGESSASHIASGILWAVANDAKVINVSFAPLWADRVIRSATQAAFNNGSLVVISAGNAGGTTRSRGYGEAVFVGAVDADDKLASFSDKGPFVDLSAPGTSVRSTSRDGKYRVVSGTSFAAPIVSGVAALVWSVNPSLRPATVQSILYDSAFDLGTVGKDRSYGYGMIDAATAVEAATVTFESPDTRPPTVKINRPLGGSTISGRYRVAIDATDRSGIADVVMFIDGVAVATDRRASYWFVLDTRAYSSGQHELGFVATDTVGNASSATSVTVTFGSVTATSAGAGRVVFRSPASGASVSGDVSIQASVSDPDGLTLLEWFVDGELVFSQPISGQSSGVSYRWAARDVEKGAYTITIRITDSFGKQTTGSITLNH
jgi:subtilisin family serine protease